MTKLFLETLNGNFSARPPFWFMRQAGRYLPEYRKLRAKLGGFLDMVYSPKDAIEITLQPIRRYHMDAAILFSDILVIPDALGQNVSFVEGTGPVLDPVTSVADLKSLSVNNLHTHLNPVYQTISGLRKELPDDVALIGFAGAPWTVATYMVEGHGSKDHTAAKDWAYGDEAGFSALIDLLIDSTSEYLIAQVNAGAEALQIFDTWAGSLAEGEFDKWVIAPTREIVRRVKAEHPEIKIIGFPRGAGIGYERFVKDTGVDAVSLDAGVPLIWARDVLQPHVVVQGNMDPRLLVTGGSRMTDQAQKIMSTLNDGGLIFNLGHGITPDVPPAHVGDMGALIKGWSKN